ncbi:MAG: hypothetical protein Alpg2KO_32640 [Alphaproteobacteria bacterium]
MLPRFSRIAALTLAITLSAGQVMAEQSVLVRGTEDRRPAKAEPGQIHSGIGKVLARGSSGTGFAVGRCHALTNHHVVESSLNRPFSFRLSGSEHKAIALAHGGSSVGPNDWAILELDPCIPRGYRIPTISLEDPRSLIRRGTRLQMAGFPFDRAGDRLWLEPDCKATGLRFDKLTTNCTSANGNSGGPVFLANSPSIPRVVAMHATSTATGSSHKTVDEDDPDYTGGAILMLGLVDQLRANVPDVRIMGSPPGTWPPSNSDDWDPRQIARHGVPDAAGQRSNPPATSGLSDGAGATSAPLEAQGFGDVPSQSRRWACGVTHRQLSIAAANGDANAQVNLAAGYQLGLFGPVNYPAANKWYRAAGRQNHPAALYNLALAYLNGHGVEPNRDAAITLLNRAIALGDTEAMELATEMGVIPTSDGPGIQGPGSDTEDSRSLWEKLLGK